ncbi:GD19778 [Drosophila simulans]|uniref:GD19778 n=1 Tax=Drosophila simulans TaxID=7240 RepID=B4QWA6_DROSI|nr:GD19778 [Drosophila simulans]
MAHKRLFVYAVLLAICYLVGVTWAETAAQTLPAIGTNSNNNSNAQPAPVAAPAAPAAAAPPAKQVPAPNAAPPAKVIGQPVSAAPGKSSSNSSSTTECVCAGALLPRLDANGKELPICAECKCSHVARNTTLIKVVVIIVIWIISILVIYMLFLMCLDPLLNKRVKANYQEHTNEDVHNKLSRYKGIQYSLLVTAQGEDDEDDDVDADAAQLDEPTPPLPAVNNQELSARANVLNRVGHQQDKWKRQVREQRRHIYDRHTMLN